MVYGLGQKRRSYAYYTEDVDDPRTKRTVRAYLSNMM